MTGEANLFARFLAQLPPHSFHLSDRLLDINLQPLPDDFFVGDWQVASRVFNRNNADTPLALANRLVLASNEVKIYTPDGTDGQTGSWVVVRDELMNRPHLGFDFPNEDTRALVMRLRRSLDGLRSERNPYFASGVEMQHDRA